MRIKVTFNVTCYDFTVQVFNFVVTTSVKDSISSCHKRYFQRDETYASEFVGCLSVGRASRLQTTFVGRGRRFAAEHQFAFHLLRLRAVLLTTKKTKQ